MRKWIFIAIGILAVICLGGFIVYNVAYATGAAAGYETGQDVGYSSGKQDGYDLGKEEGYNAGYTSGEADGYEEGMQAGLGHGYTLTDPTYDQAVAFLQEDKTNENEYIEGTYGVYVCTHFSRDVCNNAEEKGLRCAYVELRYPDAGHAIVAFNTTDRGLAYFDATTDELVRPVVGERYYKCIVPRGGYYYLPPSFDDTIMDILVVW